MRKMKSSCRERERERGFFRERRESLCVVLALERENFGVVVVVVYVKSFFQLLLVV